MGKSLELIKERIRSGGTNGMENNKYDWIEEKHRLKFSKNH